MLCLCAFDIGLLPQENMKSDCMVKSVGAAVCIFMSKD